MDRLTSTQRPFRPIRLEAVSRSFGAVKAVDGVSFTVAPGEVHALCGHNGAGKSTVVKMLAGLLQPDAGAILFGDEPAALGSPQEAQASGVALVDQELSVIPTLTVMDNVFLGGVDEPLLVRRAQVIARTRALLDAVGLKDVDPRDYVEDLPIGHRQLVEIARALGRDARLLILDEPTATLSGAEIEHVFAAVRSVAASGRSVLFVSHRLNEVMDLCQSVTVLRDGQHIDTRPTADLSVDNLVTMMLGHAHETPAPPSAPTRGGGGAPVLQVARLSVGTASDFDLEAPGGAIYALAGQVGSGASDVLRAIAGLAPDARGAVTIGQRRLALGAPGAAVRAGVAYVSNDRKGEGLFLGHTVAFNLVATRLGQLSRLGILRRGAERASSRALTDTIGVGRERLREPVLRLSGGNQQKVLLGRCLERADTRVLLLDEPTRGVDVRGRSEIHELVRSVAASGAVVVFASTELEEILDLASVVITMRSGRIVSRRDRAEADAKQILADMTHSDIGLDA